MKKWVVKKVKFDRSIITGRYGISDVTAGVLLNRGFESLKEMDEFINPFKVKLCDAGLMKDMKKACEILENAISSHKRIMIIGDYDCDGVMSTYILYKGLRALGGDVLFRLPHRVKDGYGMRDYMADEAVQKKCGLIITCDNGISASDAVKHAKEIGLDVIVTDHHVVPVENGREIIPPADAVVDPKQEDCKYPFKDMCGAGIACRLIQYMTRSDSRYNGLLVQLMIFAAVATVCDVVPLRGENRVIVSYGLRYLNSGKCTNPGFNSLVRLCNFKKKITSTDFGFRIGPCINAAGRLDGAERALSMLVEDDPEKAREKAEKIFSLNSERKDITEKGTEEALSIIQDKELLKEKILLVYLPECSEAVAGIVAGRLKKAYYRPVYVIVNSGDRLKGSGRSIPGYHMQHALQECKEHLLEFGGHELAAGFSLEKSELEPLYQALKENCRLTDDDLVEKIVVDGVVPFESVNEKIINEISLLEPFGQNNPEPVFAAADVRFNGVFIMGKTRNAGRFAVSCGGGDFTVIDFNLEEGLKKKILEKYGEDAWESLQMSHTEGLDITFSLLYKPQINDYNNTVQFRYIDAV